MEPRSKLVNGACGRFHGPNEQRQWSTSLEHLAAVRQKTYLVMAFTKYNEGINRVLSMGSVLGPPKASAVATLHPPILLVDTLHLVPQRAFSFVANS